jgi:hypothetical protein
MKCSSNNLAERVWSGSNGSSGSSGSTTDSEKETHHGITERVTLSTCHALIHSIILTKIPRLTLGVLRIRWAP